MERSTASFWLSIVAAFFLLKGVASASDEEDTLIQNPGVIFENIQNRLTYQCTYRNLWTKERHPQNYPNGTAFIAGPILWTSTILYLPWADGNTVTEGVEQLAEVSPAQCKARQHRVMRIF